MAVTGTYIQSGGSHIEAQDLVTTVIGWRLRYGFLSRVFLRDLLTLVSLDLVTVTLWLRSFTGTPLPIALPAIFLQYLDGIGGGDHNICNSVILVALLLTFPVTLITSLIPRWTFLLTGGMFYHILQLSL